MYNQYFGLREAPFSIAVNPRYLFMSTRHRDALAHLLYGVGAGGGFILLTGEVGTGKTTINRCLLEQLPHDTDIAIILNPALNALELLASVCDELGIAYETDRPTLKTLTDKLHDFLLENHSKGRKTVLMIDEAQHLDFEVLEQIRLLTNLETHSEKLLQIILIGQPELAELLARPELRQLNQRITARYNLEPLNQSETGAYIQHRLQVAGMAADREIFPPAVVRGIYRRTRGIPRLINVLCDRILLGAYGRNKPRAEIAMLRLAAREVMGEEEKNSSAGLYLGLAALALLLVLAGWWWLQPSSGPPAAIAVTRVPSPEPDPPPAEHSPPEEALPAPQNTDRVPATPVEGGGIAPAPWLLPPEDAAEMLWTFATTVPYAGRLCSADNAAGLACIETRATTWDELATIDRPLLLDLVTPERFAAAAVILGVEGRSAWLASPGGVVNEDLAEIGPLWRGTYRLLWRPPTGFERPLAQGDSAPAVAQIASLFARLDGQDTTLAENQFNADLKQRVMLFQRANGLEDDGVVGVQTLLKLNELLEIDVTASRLRRESGQRTSVVQGG